MTARGGRSRVAFAATLMGLAIRDRLLSERPPAAIAAAAPPSC